MGRAAALGMDVGLPEETVGLPEETVDQSQRKKTHSSAVRYSALLSASNIKKNLTSLIKKKKLTNDKKKIKRKSYHKRMSSSEDDLDTTDAVASQASHRKSLVNKLGMAAEPTFIRSQSQRPLSQTDQQSRRNSSVSCPGALDVLREGGEQTSLNSEYMSRETKNTINATMDARETGSNQHLTGLKPTAEEAAPPQETPPSTITPPGDDSGQSYCLDACWPTTSI
jgi:hypothetical protein